MADLDATIEAVKGGGAGSWMLANRGRQIVDRDWRPGFTIDLQQKDLRRGPGAEGSHALVKALEELAGLEVTRD